MRTEGQAADFGQLGALEDVHWLARPIEGNCVRPLEHLDGRLHPKLLIFLVLPQDIDRRLDVLVQVRHGHVSDLRHVQADALRLWGRAGRPQVGPILKPLPEDRAGPLEVIIKNGRRRPLLELHGPRAEVGRRLLLGLLPTTLARRARPRRDARHGRGAEEPEAVRIVLRLLLDLLRFPTPSLIFPAAEAGLAHVDALLGQYRLLGLDGRLVAAVAAPPPSPPHGAVPTPTLPPRTVVAAPRRGPRVGRRRAAPARRLLRGLEVREAHAARRPAGRARAAALARRRPAAQGRVVARRRAAAGRRPAAGGAQERVHFVCTATSRYQFVGSAALRALHWRRSDDPEPRRGRSSERCRRRWRFF